MWRPKWDPVFVEKNNGNKFGTTDPKKDLMDLLVEKTRALGHILTCEEANADPDMVVSNAYAFYFGSFDAAAKTAWSMVLSPMSQTNLVDNKTATTQVQDRNPSKEVKFVRTIKEPPKKGTSHVRKFPADERRHRVKKFTIADIEDILVNFYNRMGKLPTVTDTLGSDILPSWGVLNKYLGPKSDWQAIIDRRKAVDTNQGPPEETPEIIEEPDSSKAKDISNVSSEVVTQQYGNIEVKTSREEQTNTTDIEVKITLPDREKPILIHLTV